MGILVFVFCVPALPYKRPLRWRMTPTTTSSSRGLGHQQVTSTTNRGAAAAHLRHNRWGNVSGPLRVSSCRLGDHHSPSCLRYGLHNSSSPPRPERENGIYKDDTAEDVNRVLAMYKGCVHTCVPHALALQQQRRVHAPTYETTVHARIRARRMYVQIGIYIDRHMHAVFVVVGGPGAQQTNKPAHDKRACGGRGVLQACMK